MSLIQGAGLDKTSSFTWDRRDLAVIVLRQLMCTSLAPSA